MNIKYLDTTYNPKERLITITINFQDRNNL